jgi:hypothetical protein
MDVAMFDPDQFIAQKFFRSKRCSLNANKEYVLAELIHKWGPLGAHQARL